MRRLRELILRFGGPFNKQPKDRELEEEIESHIQMHIEDNLRLGMSAEEARRQAMIKLGGIESTKEAYRDQRSLPLLETLWRDIRYSARQLRKNPGFTAVSVLTLAICIGGNLSIFAVIDAILVRSLPFPEPDRLVVVHNAHPSTGIERAPAMVANYLECRKSIKAFKSVSMYREESYTVGESMSSRRVTCAQVTPEFFETLGVRLAMGEPFTDAHMDFGPNLVAILTDEFWRSYFGGDTNVLRRRIVINSQNAIVIGVLPPGYRYLSSTAEIYRPLAHHPEIRTFPGCYSELARAFDGQMVARLAKHSSILEAQTQLNVLNEQWLAADPMGQTIKDTGYHTVVAPLHEDYVGSVKPMLLLVQTGVLCLLLIGGINLVSLQLVRATGRSKETAIREALGASRWTIARSVLVETTMLSQAGGALGVAIALAGIRLVRSLGATQFPLGADITFDHRIANASIVASLVVGVCIALPIIAINRRRSAQLCLQSETRGATTSRNVQQLRQTFIVAQIAIAFVLLCGAGLLSVSLRRMLEKPTGFTSEQVLTGQVTLPWMNYRGPVTKIPFVRRLLEEVRALPGVTHAAVSSALPFTTEGSAARTIHVEGMNPTASRNLQAHYFSYVSPDYWKTMGIPLMQGRFFEDGDLQDRPRYAPGVAVIDEVFARKYWPNGDAIGRHFSTILADTKEGRDLTVIGIVGSVKQTDLAETHKLGAVYEPYSFSTDLRLLVRASVPVNTLIPSVKKRVREIDSEIPIENFKTLQVYINESLIARRSPAILAGIFAGVALLLAAIGTYGVLAYAVAQHRREIGVRLALGAMPGGIARQFLLFGLRLLAIGSLLGCVGAWAAGRAMQGVLFEVPSFHMPTLVGAAIAIGGVTLIASLLPAIRAARISPMEALRHE
ncbi:MAG: ABC transporter permease [Verrucomicrobiota bacterium]